MAGILGDACERRRWVGAEWDEVWEGYPLCSRLRGLGSVVSSPQRGPGQSPGQKTDFGHRTLLFVPI